MTKKSLILDGTFVLNKSFATHDMHMLVYNRAHKMHGKLVIVYIYSFCYTYKEAFHNVLWCWFVISRNVECTASSSFGSYLGYFGTAKSSEPSSSGQENGILNDLSGNAPLQLQLGEQYPFFSYNLNILNDAKFPPVAEMNFQETPADYHVNGVLEGPRAGYDTIQGSWASTSGPCAVTMFDEPLYSRVSLFPIILTMLEQHCVFHLLFYPQLQHDWAIHWFIHDSVCMHICVNEWKRQKNFCIFFACYDSLSSDKLAGNGPLRSKDSSFLCSFFFLLFYF